MLLAREEHYPGHIRGLRQSLKLLLATQRDSHSRVGVFGQSLYSNPWEA